MIQASYKHGIRVNLKNIMLSLMEQNAKGWKKQQPMQWLGGKKVLVK